MKIRFEQTGGLAGIPLSSAVDTNLLPVAEKEMIEKTVSEANFFNLPPSFSPPKGSADYFRYTITVEDGSSKHTVEFSNLSKAPGLEPLTKFMRKKASPSNVDAM